MCNHVHLLVEVTPRPAESLTDEQLLERVKAITSPMGVEILRKELKEAREKLAAGRVSEASIEKIHARYTYRMHDMSEFMKGVMQRFCLRSTPATPSIRASSGARFQVAA